jgi:hypothetical protein
MNFDLVKLELSQRALQRFDRERDAALMGRWMPATAGSATAPSWRPPPTSSAAASWSTKFQMRTPRYTTRLDELPAVKGKTALAFRKQFNLAVGPRESPAEQALKLRPVVSNPHQSRGRRDLPLKVRVSNVVAQELMQAGTTTPRLILGIDAPQFVEHARRQLLINVGVGELSDDAGPGNRFWIIWPAVEPEYLLVEGAGEPSRPRHELGCDIRLENLMERVALTNLLVARRLVDQSHNANTGKPAHDELAPVGDLRLLFLEANFRSCRQHSFAELD